MPLYYIFMTDLIDAILIQLLDHTYFSRYCVRCLNEIFALPFDTLDPADAEKSKLRLLECLKLFLEKLGTSIPRNKDLCSERKSLVLSRDSNKLAFFDGNCKELSLFF